MNDLGEIKERVKQAVNLADWISGAGVKLTGGPVEFKGICPFHGEKTPSFSVNTQKNIWWCFGACQKGGDIFDFVMQSKGLDFVQALKLVANSVNISVPERRVHQPEAVRTAVTTARGPFDPDRYRPLTVEGKAYRYLTEERKLDGGLLVDYGVGETNDGEAYVFAYKWFPPGMPKKEGVRPRFEFVKAVKVDRVDGKKVEWRDPKGGKSILFGMTAVPDGAEALVICEGEIDAITWAQYGFAAVSVPGGAGYTGWIDACWEWLQRFKKISISFDEDRAGRQKVVEVVQRLGIARTDIVRLPVREESNI